MENLNVRNVSQGLSSNMTCTGIKGNILQIYWPVKNVPILEPSLILRSMKDSILKDTTKSAPSASNHSILEWHFGITKNIATEATVRISDFAYHIIFYYLNIYQKIPVIPKTTRCIAFNNFM